MIAQQTSSDILWFLYDSDGTRVGFTYNGTAYYYTKNAQGDVTGIVDGNCNTVVEYSYDAWGKLLSTTGSLAGTIGKVNPFLYRGYCYDSETGLYYLNSRYYDPQTGRFISADGAVSTGTGILGHNMFAYCNNNPISMTDSDGTRPLSEPGIETPQNQMIAVQYENQAAQSSRSKAANEGSKKFVTGSLKGIASGTADAYLTQTISDLPNIERTVSRVGPGVGVVVSESRQIASVTVMQSITKFAGVLSVGALLWDINQDSQKYQGDDLKKAVAVSGVTFLAGIGTGLILSGIGAPVGVAIVAGALIGSAISLGEDKAKKQWIGY